MCPASKCVIKILVVSVGQTLWENDSCLCAKLQLLSFYSALCNPKYFTELDGKNIGALAQRDVMLKQTNTVGNYSIKVMCLAALLWLYFDRKGASQSKRISWSYSADAPNSIYGFITNSTAFSIKFPWFFWETFKTANKSINNLSKDTTAYEKMVFCFHGCFCQYEFFYFTIARVLMR